MAREAELERLLDVISRRRANHPLLVGPSGVGKTSVVHALARAVAMRAPETRGLVRNVVVEVSAPLRERQRAVGYEGNYRAWIAKVTPADLQ